MLYISHSSSETAKQCWMKYKWSYIDRLKPIYKPTILTIGAVMHDAFDLFYKGASDADCHTFIDKRFGAVISSGLSPVEAEDIQIAQATVKAMWENYPHKDRTEFEEVRSELTFEVPLGYKRGVMIVGRVDGLVKKRGNWWIRECKVTGMSDRQLKIRSETTSQATGYVYGLRLLGHPIKGILFDAVKRPRLRKGVSETTPEFAARIMQDYKERPDRYYHRDWAYRNPIDLKHYENDMARFADDLRRKKREHGWYRSHGSCWMYNSECPFKKICFQDKPDKITLDLYFEKRKERK